MDSSRSRRLDRGPQGCDRSQVCHREAVEKVQRIARRVEGVARIRGVKRHTELALVSDADAEHEEPDSVVEREHDRAVFNGPRVEGVEVQHHAPKP